MEPMREARRLNSRLLSIFTCTLLSWTRRVHSREALEHSPIENIWKVLSLAGLQDPLVNSTGITASVCGETIPKQMVADMVAASDSTTNFTMAGLRSPGLPSAPATEPRLSK